MAVKPLFEEEDKLEPRYGGVNLEDKDALGEELGVPVMSRNDFPPQAESPAASLISSLGEVKPQPQPAALKSSISEPVLRYMAQTGDERAKKVLEDAYGPELGDEALKSALEEKRKRESDLDWNIIAGQFGKAYAAGEGAENIDPVSAYTKKKIGEAGRPVEDIETRRKGLDQATKRKGDLLDLGNKEQTSSPDSDISKMARSFAKDKLGLSVPDAVSYDAMKGLMGDSRLFKQFEDQVAARKDMAESAREDRKLTRDIQSGQREKDRALREDKTALDYTEKLETNHLMKQFAKEGLALDQVTNLLDLANKGNTVAFAAVGPKMARAMGEVGVLTQADVENYVRSGALARGAADKLSLWIKGKPTQATREEIGQISSALKDQFKGKVQPIFDKYANRLSRNLDIPIEEAYYKLDVPMPGAKEEVKSSAQPTVDQSKPSGKIRVSNGSETLEIDSSDLEDATKDGYQKVQ